MVFVINVPLVPLVPPNTEREESSWGIRNIDGIPQICRLSTYICKVFLKNPCGRYRI